MKSLRGAPSRTNTAQAQRKMLGLTVRNIIIDEIQNFDRFEKESHIMARIYKPRKHTKVARIMEFLEEHPNKVFKGREIFDATNLFTVSGEGRKSYAIGSPALCEVTSGVQSTREGRDRDPEPGVIIVQEALRGSTGAQSWPDVMIRYTPPVEPEVGEDLLKLLADAPIVEDPAAYDLYSVVVEIRDLMRAQLVSTRELVAAWTSSAAIVELTSTEDSENEGPDDAWS